MELFFVLLVVPNPGIVIPTTILGERFNLFTAAADTKSARVESSPPETPTTIHLHLVVSILLIRPATCMLKIERLLSNRLLLGTNGVIDTCE